MNPRIDPRTFRFTPPADTKEVARLEPDWYVPAPSTPKTSLSGQPAPDVVVTTPGGKVALSSYRGRPLLLDFWATWCGPCIASMPGFHRIYKDVKDNGVAVITFDQDHLAESAAEYLARHQYWWTNYHDSDGAISSAFKVEGIPLTVLIDGQGKIVYYDFGGDEAAVRKAIAALGPEYASIATPVSSNSAPPRR